MQEYNNDCTITDFILLESELFVLLLWLLLGLCVIVSLFCSYTAQFYHDLMMAWQHQFAKKVSIHREASEL